MNTISEVLRSVFGLFVDDELLAVGVLVVVGLTALLMHVSGMSQIAAGLVLLFGNILVLVIGAVRTSRRLP